MHVDDREVDNCAAQTSQRLAATRRHHRPRTLEPARSHPQRLLPPTREPCRLDTVRRCGALPAVARPLLPIGAAQPDDDQSGPGVRDESSARRRNPVPQRILPRRGRRVVDRHGEGLNGGLTGCYVSWILSSLKSISMFPAHARSLATYWYRSPGVAARTYSMGRPFWSSAQR